MTITRASTTPTKRGPAAWFTGIVWLDEISAGAGGSSLRALRVTFEPGARTAWHTHPHGQMLHVLSGVARIGRAGVAPVDVQSGDSVWFEAGERHWHGGAPGHLMTHLAIQQVDASGNSADWFEYVSDADYAPEAK